MRTKPSLLSLFIGATLMVASVCDGQVTAINPTCGPTAGGTPISITGSNFTGVTSVTIGGAPVLNVVVVNAGLITGHTPGGSPGPKNVTVCNGQGCTTLVGEFSHVPMNATNLVVNGSFEQTSMTGWNVTGGGVDIIDWAPPVGMNAIDMNASSPGAIQQSIPTATGRNYLVTFWVAGNTDGPPMVKTLNASAGAAGSSFSFDITGKTHQNMGWKCKSFVFTAAGPSTSLQLASTTASSPFGPALDGVAVYELTTITAPTISPIGTPINYSLQMSPSTPYIMDVSTNGSVPGTVVNGVLIPLNAPFLNYDFGASLPGVFVNFLGSSNALGVASATVNVPNAPVLIGIQLTAIFATLEATPSGIGAVAEPVVTTIVGPAPVISTVAPPTGPAPGGTTLAISGANFSPGAAVKIGGVTAINPAVTPTFIVCTTPAGSLGPKDVRVENPGGLFTVSPGAFTYVPLLVISSVSPLAAPAGASVALAGTGIQPGATVTVGGLSAQVLTQSPTSLTFAEPTSVPCNTSILVTNPDGQTATIAFNPTPIVTGVVNGSGPIGGGNSFAVLGSNFLPGSTLAVGGAAATITFQSLTFLVCTAPPGALGPATILVTTPGGCTATGAYTYQ